MQFHDVVAFFIAVISKSIEVIITFLDGFGLVLSEGPVDEFFHGPLVVRF